MFLPRVKPDGLISRVTMGGPGGTITWMSETEQMPGKSDIFYHTAHDNSRTIILLVDAGHHIEVVCRKQLAKWARGMKEEKTIGDAQ